MGKRNEDLKELTMQFLDNTEDPSKEHVIELLLALIDDWEIRGKVEQALKRGKREKEASADGELRQSSESETEFRHRTKEQRQER